MAVWQLLLFRKGCYRERVGLEDYEREVHEKNIKRKRRQIVLSNWKFYIHILIMPITGFSSGVVVVYHARKIHIATQKLRVLEEEWKKRYQEDEVPGSRNSPVTLRRVYKITIHKLKGICLCTSDIGGIMSEIDDDGVGGDGDISGNRDVGSTLYQQNQRSDLQGTEEKPMRRRRREGSNASRDAISLVDEDL